ncbi:hypothetical protein [Paenirhodobacter enshiensis]|uniref:hypothetical protein n=1 Tax=Paenirhodobacter enshiensis TaxID=1105367 RepID=UPI000691CFC8|nr:hypothetical protein [Paenirhodobacter enshiensis]
MYKMSGAIVAVALVGSLSACAHDTWESVPMLVKSSQGNVICQLYGRDQVLWDTSIAHPDAMSKDDADQVCRAEGQRVKDDKSIIAQEVVPAAPQTAATAPKTHKK